MKQATAWLTVFVALVMVVGTLPVVGQALDLGDTSLSVSGSAVQMDVTPSGTHASRMASQCEPLAGVEVSGPATGYTGLSYTFAGAITPLTATLPVTYTWSPEPDAGQGEEMASYAFAAPGTWSIALEATNCGGAVTGTASISILQQTYLPFVSKPGLPPPAPTLYPIENADGDGSYSVSWSASTGATLYTLQEDDNPAFSSPAAYPVWPSTSWTVGAQAPGIWYYRVNASNEWGTSAWSNVQSVTVNGWQTLLYTDFETSFPGPWIVFDNNGVTGGEYFWGRRDCEAASGSYSGWAVGGGANGSVLSCGSYYPNNAASWMIYGPFSLAGASAADLSLDLWLDTEPYHDGLGIYASTNGSSFDGIWYHGYSAGWVNLAFDLSDAVVFGQNLLGQAQVWVALIFDSDSATTYPEGGYVDNIVLRRAFGVVADPAPRSTPGLPAGLEQEPASRTLER